MLPGHHHAASVVKLLPLADCLLLGGHLKIGPQHQGAVLIAVVFDAVAYRSGILTVLHAEPALHYHAVHVVFPAGGVMHGVLSQPAVAVLIGGAVGKILGGQEVFPVTAAERFADAVHQIDAHIGGLPGSHKDALVAPGRRKNAGHRGVAAQTVCQQKIIFTGIGG